MIFHAVGTDGSYELLDVEVPLTHSEFFLGRVKATSSGIMFDFEPNSAVESSLRVVDSDRTQFVPESKSLTALFQNQHTSATSRGAFVIIVLTCDTGTVYALIKIDNENVLAYEFERVGGKMTANIDDLANTLVQSPEALQKSALIRLHEEGGGEICLRDRSAPGDVTRYFKAFLNAKRRHNATELTKKIAEMAGKAAAANAATLPPDVMRNIKYRIHSALQTLPTFDSTSPEFVNAVFGAVTNETPVVRDFFRRMRREDIEHESFSFDRTAVPRPRQQRIVTDENIQIIYDRQYAHLVTTEDLEGGRKRIVIESGGVREVDDYAG